MARDPLQNNFIVVSCNFTDEFCQNAVLQVYEFFAAKYFPRGLSFYFMDPVLNKAYLKDHVQYESLKVGEIGVYYKTYLSLFWPESKWNDKSLDGLLTYTTMDWEQFEELIKEFDWRV